MLNHGFDFSRMSITYEFLEKCKTTKKDMHSMDALHIILNNDYLYDLIE